MFVAGSLQIDHSAQITKWKRICPATTWMVISDYLISKTFPRVYIDIAMFPQTLLYIVVDVCAHTILHTHECMHAHTQVHPRTYCNVVALWMVPLPQCYSTESQCMHGHAWYTHIRTSSIPAMPDLIKFARSRLGQSIWNLPWSTEQCHLGWWYLPYHDAAVERSWIRRKHSLGYGPIQWLCLVGAALLRYVGLQWIIDIANLV